MGKIDRFIEIVTVPHPSPSCENRPWNDALVMVFRPHSRGLIFLSKIQYYRYAPYFQAPGVEGSTCAGHQGPFQDQFPPGQWRTSLGKKIEPYPEHPGAGHVGQPLLPINKTIRIIVMYRARDLD